MRDVRSSSTRLADLRLNSANESGGESDNPETFTQEALSQWLLFVVHYKFSFEIITKTELVERYCPFTPVADDYLTVRLAT